MRLLRETRALTSLLISFTRSIFNLSLAVLVTDCQFWRLLRLKVPIMVVTKILVSVTTGLLIMLPFRHALLTACGNRHFQTILKSQFPSLSPRHGLLRSTLQSNVLRIFLSDIVLQAHKMLLLGKRIKIRWRVLQVANLYNHVRCCQLRALHDFFPHVSTFFCHIRDLVTDAAHRARVLFSSACAVHPHVIGIMPIQAQSPYQDERVPNAITTLFLQEW